MDKKWLEKVESALIGRKIIKVKYLNAKTSMDVFGWNYQPFEIYLDNGVILTPSADDEGNNAGAIFTNVEEIGVIGVERNE
jgi:hypothetical protein